MSGLKENSLKIVFLGTPEFAVPSLEILIRNNYDIVAVVTSADKAAGRGLQLQSSPIKKFALNHGLQVLQPNNLKDENFIDDLKKLNADLQVVVAFRMLPEVVWSMPRLGTFNLHASLLPLYRGAAPINRAIMNGETETGLTTFFLKQEIDTGKIIFQDKISIVQNETAGELHDRMKIAGAELVLKTVQAIGNGDYPQVEQPVTNNLKKAPKIFKEDCRINWNENSNTIHNQIRGLSPHPGAFTFINDKILKIFSAGKIMETPTVSPGQINTAENSVLRFAAQDGWIEVHELQLEGKRIMKTVEFLKGFRF
ncbi:MAG: methionyl-tRNA formyltransferase [Chitinophagales bacterium]|nr:methionyl-tRNA formyltransferase [Chitinophagales bacterium]